MIRRSIRYVVYTARRRPKRCILLCTPIVILVVIMMLLVFYWDIWEISSSSTSSDQSNKGFDYYYNEKDQGDSFQYKRPEPLQCPKKKDDDYDKTTTTTTTTNPKFCTWNKTLEECFHTLQPLKNTSSWVFLGGSDMSSIVEYVSMKKKWSSNDDNNDNDDVIVKTTSRRNNCQNLLYYKLPPSKQWTLPDPKYKGEGPIGYGLKNPYCTDCRNCWNVRMDATIPTTDDDDDDTTTKTKTTKQRRKQQQYIEYLVVEYTRDVSIPTLVTNTTQETVAYYLKSQLPEVCVVSVGLLDVMIYPPISQSMFVQNMDRYISLLQRVCGNVIWISIPAIIEDTTLLPQFENCQLQEWNVGVIQMLQQRNYNNVYVIDIWEQTLQADHATYLKLHKKFYDALARLFVTIMVGQ